MAYALELAHRQIERLLAAATGASGFEISAPPPNVAGDLAVPLFRLAKERGVAPAVLGAELAATLELAGTLLGEVTVNGGFLNFKLADGPFVAAVFEDFLRLGEAYGGGTIGEGKTVVIDFSSPNIAKPFSVGHLRSTVLGDSLGRILRFLGYRVVGDNHIGDWGTQFGKLTYAYANWGDRETVAADPIRELLALYVRFHEEAKTNPAIEAGARDWFRRLEEGDPEVRALWQWFKDLSWQEFERIYELLGVHFDEVLGESFFNDQLADVIRDAFDKGLAEWAEVAVAGEGADGDDTATTPEKVALIHLAAHGIETPLLIQKSDGTSLYATRDLATIRYRVEHWHPETIVYVVGGEQKLYFQQVFKAAELLGYGANCVHVPFGLIRLPGGKMSTREGRVIFLEEVLDEAVRRAEVILAERELSPEEKREIAKVVGIGAVKYADLSQTRTKDVVFDWDKMLNMQGDSAPYLQYAYVRVRSIGRKAEGLEGVPVDPALLVEPLELGLVRTLARFPDVVRTAAAHYQPHGIAGYLVTLARDFSSFYKQLPVLKAEPEELAATRLALCRATGQVLGRGLALLGIDVLERM